MHPTAMAEESMFPTCGSNSSGGEPDAVKAARPVRWGGWRRPAGVVRPLAAPSPPNAFRSVDYKRALQPTRRFGKSCPGF